MSNRARGYGLTAETKAKIMSKYDHQLEQDAVQWIEAILGGGTMKGAVGPDAVHQVLKDGVILGRLMNAIKPDSVKKIRDDTTRPAFLMENTGKFLTACENYGVKKADLFQTADLYDNTNMGAVITGLQALGRKASVDPSFDGPAFGPKESTENKREFSEEQMAAGKNVIGLQMGTNKGASQAGMTMGKSRAIID